MYWKGKKLIIDTSYKQEQPKEKQPTCIIPEDFELYELKYLTPQEDYTFTTTNKGEEEWITYTPRYRSPPKYKSCGLRDHQYKDCPQNEYKYCHEIGHIVINCPNKQNKRANCKNCNQTDHLFKDCPQNLCFGCKQMGHIEINCPLAQQKLDNLTYRCGCDKTQIEAKRLDHYSRRRTHHCCQCLTPQTPDKLYFLDNQLTCTVCYKTFHEELELNDPRSQEYYRTGLGRGTLVHCKVCNYQKPRTRMHQLESIREELWFCELEYIYVYKVCQDLIYNKNYKI